MFEGRHFASVSYVLWTYIPDEELFSEIAVGAPLHTLSKLYVAPVGFVTPPPPLCFGLNSIYSNESHV